MKRVLIATLFAATAGLAQTAPGQPTTGPGGSSYPHGGVVTKGPYIPPEFQNDPDFQYFIFEPARPRPAQAAVVLFLHGYQGHKPAMYWGWIAHMVRKGYTVVWVRWDQGGVTTWKFADQAQVGWKDALNRLVNNTWEGHVPPARDGSGNLVTAMVGHSAGGWLSAVLAARSAELANGMPMPRAIVAIEPGGPPLIPGGPFEDIDPTTKLVLVAGEDDTNVCIETAKTLWERTAQIPGANRDFLLVRTDTRGTPQQVANHWFPTTAGTLDTATLDTRDFFVTFKLSVGALNCRFKGTDCQYAMGNGAAEQTWMGRWSDSIPVKPMLWVADPSTLTAACEGP